MIESAPKKPTLRRLLNQARTAPLLSKGEAAQELAEGIIEEIESLSERIGRIERGAAHG